MQIAKMRLKFRNDIRTRQINEHKDAIRQRLLAERDQESRVEEEMRMQYEALGFSDDCGMSEQQARRMNEVITDFECNCSEMVSDCLNAGEKEEGEEMSESSSNSSYIEHLASLSKDVFDISLSDLECIAFFCCQAQTQDQLEPGYKSIALIADIFYVVMEKYLPELIDRPNPTWSKLYYRLKKVWAVCQKILLPSMLRKFQADSISNEESVFATNLIVYKVSFLFKYRLLANRAILQQNQHYFGYLFNGSLQYDSLLFRDKLKAAYFLIMEYGFEASWTANHHIFFQFIQGSVAQYKAMVRNQPKLQSSQCVILMLKMVEWVFSSERSQLLTEIYVKPEEGFLSGLLEVGLHLQKSLKYSIDDTYRLFSTMVHVIFLCQLKDVDFYHQLIGLICEQAVLSSTLLPCHEIVAVEMLSILRIDRQEAFIKLRIHYTFSLRDNCNYAPFLEFVERVLEGL